MNILFIDNDKDVVEWVHDVLELAGHKVEQVFDVVDAKSKISQAHQAGHWPYELMILETMMIDPAAKSQEDHFTTGVRLHNEFRTMFPDAKVMFLTTLPHLVPEELREGANTITRDTIEMTGVHRLPATVREFTAPSPLASAQTRLRLLDLLNLKEP